MHHRTPLQRLLHRLLPSRLRADTVARAQDFPDTCPDDSHVLPPRAAHPMVAPPPGRPIARGPAAIDLVLGTEVMEYRDDTAANLMDEFFAKPAKRAA